MNEPVGAGARILRRLAALLVWGPGAPFVLGDLDEAMRRDLERGVPPMHARWRYARNALASAVSLWRDALGRHRETARSSRGIRWLEDAATDLGHAGRTLGRKAGLTAVVLGTLAVGIGASLVIYSAGRALVSDAVPFPDADRLVAVDLRGDRGIRANPSYRELRIWEAEAGGLLTLGGYTFGTRFVGDGSRTLTAPGARVTAGFFPALGVEPLLGRTFSPGEVGGGEPVAVLTQRLWEGGLGADPEVVGRTIRIDGRPHTVVGVVPSGMQFPPGADLWTPLAATEEEASSLRVGVIGRLETDVTTRRAQAALAAIRLGPDGEDTADEGAKRAAVLSPVGQPPGMAGTALVLLQGAALALLLIAATHAAGLVLTNAIERRQELAVRASLGASRGRVVRQLLAESTLLASTSAILGLFVAHAGIAALRSTSAAAMTRNMMGWDRFGLDGHAVGFALVLAALTALVLGLVPALRATSGDVSAQLRDGAPTATRGRRGRSLARLLLGGEVALALTLLVCAGLLARSLQALLGADPGFEAEGVLAVEWALPPDRYDDGEAVTALQERLLERLAAIPGVGSVDLVSNLPMSRTGWSKPYRVEGSDPGSDETSASWRPVTPGYLRALGVALRRGRHLAPTDEAGAPRAAVIGEALAERHWPDGADPLGRSLEVDGETWTVVGVVGDVHNFGIERRAEPTIYVPQAQSPTRAGFLAVRAADDPAALAPFVRQELWSVDPDIAIGQVRTLPEMVAEFYAGERLLELLMAALASISLLITLVSLYTLVAHSVARRRHEIGIRITLGAHRRQILVGAMGQVVVWVGAGVAVGLVLSAGASRVMSGMLYGVAPLDPAVFILAPVGLLAVAVLASWVPARRATAIDPTEAVRGG